MQYNQLDAILVPNVDYLSRTVDGGQALYARTMGYYTPGDGGGSQGDYFVWREGSTVAIDGVRFFSSLYLNPNSPTAPGRWEQIFSTEVSDLRGGVKASGNQADTVTNDTQLLAVIAAAIEQLKLPLYRPGAALDRCHWSVDTTISQPFVVYGDSRRTTISRRDALPGEVPLRLFSLKSETMNGYIDGVFKDQRYDGRKLACPLWISAATNPGFTEGDPLTNVTQGVSLGDFVKSGVNPTSGIVYIGVDDWQSQTNVNNGDVISNGTVTTTAVGSSSPQQAQSHSSVRLLSDVPFGFGDVEASGLWLPNRTAAGIEIGSPVLGSINSGKIHDIFADDLRTRPRQAVQDSCNYNYFLMYAIQADGIDVEPNWRPTSPVTSFYTEISEAQLRSLTPAIPSYQGNMPYVPPPLMMSDVTVTEDFHGGWFEAHLDSSCRIRQLTKMSWDYGELIFDACKIVVGSTFSNDSWFDSGINSPCRRLELHGTTITHEDGAVVTDAFISLARNTLFRAVSPQTYGSGGPGTPALAPFLNHQNSLVQIEGGSLNFPGSWQVLAVPENDGSGLTVPYIVSASEVGVLDQLPHDRLFTGDPTLGIAANFDVQTTVSCTFRVGTPTYTLAADTVADTGTTEVISPGKWGLALLFTTTALTMTTTWYSTLSRTVNLALSTSSDRSAMADSALTFYANAGSYYVVSNNETIPMSGGTFPAGKWGIALVSAEVATGSPLASVLRVTWATNASAGYNDEATAIAALPATPSGDAAVGYITVQANASHPFVGGTDALAGGSTGNPAQTTHYVNTLTVTGYDSELAASVATPITPVGSVIVGTLAVQATNAHSWTAGTDALAGGAGGTPAQTTNYHTGLVAPFGSIFKPPSGGTQLPSYSTGGSQKTIETYVLPDSGTSAVQLDWLRSSVQQVTITGDCAISTINQPPTYQGMKVNLIDAGLHALSGNLATLWLWLQGNGSYAAGLPPTFGSGDNWIFLQRMNGNTYASKG